MAGPAPRRASIGPGQIPIKPGRRGRSASGYQSRGKKREERTPTDSKHGGTEDEFRVSLARGDRGAFPFLILDRAFPLFEDLVPDEKVGHESSEGDHREGRVPSRGCGGSESGEEKEREDFGRAGHSREGESDRERQPEEEGLDDGFEVRREGEGVRDRGEGREDRRDEYQQGDDGRCGIVRVRKGEWDFRGGRVEREKGRREQDGRGEEGGGEKSEDGDERAFRYAREANQHVA